VTSVSELISVVPSVVIVGDDAVPVIAVEAEDVHGQHIGNWWPSP
jgi:hypothetical protein